FCNGCLKPIPMDAFLMADSKSSKVHPLESVSGSRCRILPSPYQSFRSFPPLTEGFRAEGYSSVHCAAGGSSFLAGSPLRGAASGGGTNVAQVIPDCAW